MFIVLLNFSESLTITYLSFNHEPCMIRPTLIDLNLIEFKYYPFIISSDTGKVLEFVMSYHQKYVFQRNKRHQCQSVWYDKKQKWN